MKLSRRRLSWALALAIAPCAAQASVSFQNEGTLTGWTNYPQNPCCGPINQVSSPTFQGSTAIRYEQTFTGFGSYHNEVIKSPSCAYGSDCYYGLHVVSAEHVDLPRPEHHIHAVGAQRQLEHPVDVAVRAVERGA